MRTWAMTKDTPIRTGERENSVTPRKDAYLRQEEIKEGERGKDICDNRMKKKQKKQQQVKWRRIASRERRRDENIRRRRETQGMK